MKGKRIKLTSGMHLLPSKRRQAQLPDIIKPLGTRRTTDYVHLLPNNVGGMTLPWLWYWIQVNVLYPCAVGRKILEQIIVSRSSCISTSE
jgi:hypothetical protein